MSSYFDNFNIISYLIKLDNLTTILIIVVIVNIILSNKNKLIPSRTQLIIKIIINHWEKTLEDQKIKEIFLLPITSIFLLLITINLAGFIINVIPISAQISITFGIAIIIWSSLVLLAIYNFKANFLSSLIPDGAPIMLTPLLTIIEIISNCSRPIALGMRLAANITAGHILLSIIANFSLIIIIKEQTISSITPIIVMILVTCLEIGVIFIQAYVFTLLISIYLKESIILH